MFKAKQNEAYSSNVANGFNFRKKLNKEQRKFATRIPFSLIAKNKSLSKNLFGIVTTNELDFNIQAKPLSNTHFISFSYEEYINKIIKPKLSVKNLKLTFLAVNNQTNILKNITNNNDQAIGEPTRIQRKKNEAKKVFPQLFLKKMFLSDILQHKLSNETIEYLRKFSAD